MIYMTIYVTETDCRVVKNTPRDDVYQRLCEVRSNLINALRGRSRPLIVMKLLLYSDMPFG